ncbi:MAG TPA: lysophospholipid acyltransferase family protein, partial [Turneriella sp.]|nr:lysophospholipid acyltransferase family protein [Turneriella sp.]
AYYLGGIFPRHTVVVAKKEMKKVPLFGITLKASRTIFVDREDSSDTKRALKQAIDTIKKDKNHIWIFPEGTRSQGKGLGEFKKGAFAMAIASGAPIVPIINEPMERLLDIPNKTLHKGTQHVKILPAIPTEGMKFRDMDALHDKVRALFEKEIAAF